MKKLFIALIPVLITFGPGLILQGVLAGNNISTVAGSFLLTLGLILMFIIMLKQQKEIDNLSSSQNDNKQK